MGLLTDFFIASSEELESVDLEVGPAGMLPTVQAKGFDPVQLVSLQSHMQGVPEHAIRQMTVKERGDASIVALSTEFRDALAVMDDAAVTQFGDDWLLSDDEVSVLIDVGGLARQAQREGQDLYVWIAL